MSGWGKNMIYLSLKKSANIRGNKWKNGEKEDIFTVLGGKNIILEKRGWGKNINYLDNIDPW